MMRDQPMYRHNFGPPQESPRPLTRRTSGWAGSGAWVTMAGWIRFDVTGWATQRLEQPGPWVEAMAVLDLRYWSDPKACDGRKRPSERALAAAWGWDRNRVHRLIGCVDRWADPHRTNGEPRVNQERTKREPTGPEATPAIERARTKSEPTVNQDRTKREPDPKGDTRASTAQTHTPTPRTTLFDYVSEVWVDCKKAQLKREGRPGPVRVQRPKKGKGVGVALNARVKDDGAEDVVAVIRWATSSLHPRAVFLRSSGHCTLKTLTRPSNFEEYVALAADPVEPARAVIKAPEEEPLMTEKEYAEAFPEEYAEQMAERAAKEQEWQ